MLQQTQVDTVIPYFDRFVRTFPTVRDLARAPESDVLRLWAGLGYYRRCRGLHAAARAMVERHEGEVPSDPAALEALPGIGRYTAGAIASIAFGRPAPVLDGNVARVLSRLLALDLPAGGTEGRRALWAEAGRLLDPADPSTHNQALMELGALVCTPRDPRCAECPLRPDCRAAASPDATRWPRTSPRRKPARVRAVSGLLRDAEGRVLVGTSRGRASGKAGLVSWLRDRVGLDARVGRRLASVDHVFTHRRLTLDVYEVVSFDGAPRPTWYAESRFVPTSELGTLPLSRLTEKVLGALGVTLG
jgi:A/G-specific adenine glycosylase